MNTRALRLAPLLLVACQATDTGAEPRSIRYLVAQGDFRVALQQARDAWEADPANLELEEDYRFATVAILLERGRQATFDGRDEEALLDFQEALSLAPDAEQAAHWVEKTQLKLSRRWYLAAGDLHTADELLEAAKSYEQALMYVPDSVDALEGLIRVGVQLDYREVLSDDYYNEGLGALRKVDLHVAGSRFDYAKKYRYGDDKPVQRREEVDGLLSERFVGSALQLEEQGFFAAARAEFRVALDLDGENWAAEEGYMRMEVESDVHELLKQGEMWINRGGFDEAISVLREGRDRTAVQQDRFDELLGEIDDLRTAAAYEHGLNFEYDFRYHDAAATYGELLSERGFYKDARARLTRIEQVIAEVEGLYGSLDGLSGDELRGALEHIDVLWPEYLDVQQRLDALDG